MMEDDKKKKKNKKKKSKQNKLAGDVINGIGEPANENQIHVIEKDYVNSVPEVADVRNEVAEADVGVDKHCSNSNEGMALEETIETSQAENDTNMEQQDSLEEELRRLQNENDIHFHKQAALESKLLQLENDKDSWLQKQARLEEEFSQLIDKTTNLSHKEASLEEKVKQLEKEKEFWFEKENSTKETIANLDGNVTRLQTQVMELEASKNYMLHENQQLAESISSMQLQIQILEKSIASGIFSSSTRMVNDLDAKPDTRSVTMNVFPAARSESAVEITGQPGIENSPFNFTESTSAPIDQVKTPSDILNSDEINNGSDLNVEDTAHVTESLSFEDVAFRSEGEDQRQIGVKETIVDSPYANGTAEIVQIPLDENQVADPVLQPVHDDEEKTNIPLSDSPLIGAPFRLVSFFGRYISGVDLVNKS